MKQHEAALSSPGETSNGEQTRICSDQPLRVVIFNLVSAGVELGLLSNIVRKIHASFEETCFFCELDGIIFSPVLMGPGFEEVPNRLIWRPRTKTYDVIENIDYGKWQASTNAGRKKMLEQCLVDSVARIPAKRLSGISKEVITGVIHQTFKPKPRAKR